MDSSVTSSSLKALNRRRVLDAVYAQRKISKQGLAQNLAMSLPTVSQNLKSIEAIGLIERGGLFESTGGRKAQIYHFAATARIAIGIILLKEGYHIVAVDLYGQTLKSEFFSVPLSRNERYFQQFGNTVNNFIRDLTNRPDQILGVSIAMQGLVSAGGDYVFYGEVVKCTGLTLKEVQRWIDYPCIFIHDTEATAMAELWTQKDLRNAVLLSLSRNFSGILIIDGKVHKGLELSGTIEHMRLYPNGHLCYCGKHGCIETYCSSDALLRDAGEPLDRFFEKLRNGDVHHQEIWQTYLQNLALAINNIRMVVDQEFVICGYLLKFMNDSDFSLLTQYVREDCSFDASDISIRRSIYSEDVAACGAAISLVKSFLESL